MSATTIDHCPTNFFNIVILQDDKNESSLWETAVRVSKSKLSGDDSDSCLLLSLLLGEVQNLLLRLFEVVDAACTLSTNSLKASHGSFVMDDFMANLFGFPPGSRMFVNDHAAFQRALMHSPVDAGNKTEVVLVQQA